MDSRDSKKRKLDTPSARQTSPGRPWTLSIAIPSSILADCSTADQRMVIPGRIARALAVFSVDEVVIYEDGPPRPHLHDAASAADFTTRKEYTGDTDPCHFLAHVFSYLETPPFMRKTLFPMHPNLRLAGLLPTLDMQSHPHMRDDVGWREGFTVAERPKGGKGTFVDVGLNDLVELPDSIPPKTRVTVHFPDHGAPEAAHPKAPRLEGGLHWGYDVRRCGSLSSVFTESPFEDGYDVSIGTSERGTPVAKAFPYSAGGGPLAFSHMLVVFGGPRGIEWAASNDGELAASGITTGKTKELFDHWVNVLPNQGSRGIRTDEAVFIALTALRRLWEA